MSNDLILPIERRLNTQTEVEILALYLTGKLDLVKLSDKLQERLTRMEVCRDLYKKYRSKSKTVDEMMKLSWLKADNSTHTISAATANRDFDDAVELFNMLFDTRGLNFHVDFLLADIVETRKKALIDHDWKTAAACDKNYLLVLEKFFGNQDAEKYRNLQPPVIITDFIPEQSKVKLPDDWEKQVKRLLAKKKRTQLHIEDAEIIEADDQRDNGENQDS